LPAVSFVACEWWVAPIIVFVACEWWVAPIIEHHLRVLVCRRRGGQPLKLPEVAGTAFQNAFPLIQVLFTLVQLQRPLRQPADQVFSMVGEKGITDDGISTAFLEVRRGFSVT